MTAHDFAAYAPAFILTLAALTTLASLLTRGRVKAFVVALMGGVE